jgi:predicted nucleic acid-binding protein
MSKIVTGSSALILLSRCGLIKKLCNFYDVYSPSSVIFEVASDEMIANYPDAALVAELVSNQKIKIQDPKGIKHKLPMTLHQGEKDALYLALNLNWAIFATDDKKAIKAAKFFNLPYIITPKIVIDLLKLKKISYKEARWSIEKLSVIGRYSPDIIANVLLALNEEIK